MNQAETVKAIGTLSGAVRKLWYKREGNWLRSRNSKNEQKFCLVCQRLDGSPLPADDLADRWRCRRCKEWERKPGMEPAPAKRESLAISLLRRKNSWMNSWRNW